MYIDYPLSIEYKTSIGKHYYSDLSLIQQSEIGIKYLYPIKDSSAKIYAIAYYSDNTYIELYSEYNIYKNVNGELTADMLSDIFKTYEDKNPISIEFIITLQNCCPLKWILYIQ